MARFKTEEMLVLNIYEPESYNGAEHSFESYGNVICDEVGATFYAPDYDGTTDGSAKGFNVLILREDLSRWKRAAEKLGAYVEASDLIPEPRRYGDGGWEGVYLIDVGDGWLEWRNGPLEEDSE